MEKEMQEIVKNEMKRYPKSQPQDILKLLVQSYLGSMHAEFDSITSLSTLVEEKEAVRMEEEVVYIGNGVCRVPVSFMKKEDIPLWNLLFLCTMKNFTRKEKQLKVGLQELSRTTLFDPIKLEKILHGIRHSVEYKEAYDPHYRVMRQAYVDYFPAIRLVYHKCLLQRDVVLAIDGRCASGKSFLATLLGEVFETRLFHVDDYFLQSFQRNKKRLHEIGGNVDYERFQKEIIEALHTHEDIVYQVYDCQRDVLLAKQKISYQPLTIIEGSYSQHPYMKKYMDVRIFLTCSEEEQRIRLKKRSPLVYHRFIEEWIPKEESYFSYNQIENKQDLSIDTSSFSKRK